MATIWKHGATRKARNAREGDEIAELDLGAAKDLARADEHDRRRPRRRAARSRTGPSRDVAVSDFSTLSSRRPHAGGEHTFLPRLRVIALHHPHAAQRFGEAPGDLRVDLAALAENRPDGGERLLQRERRKR